GHPFCSGRESWRLAHKTTGAVRGINRVYLGRLDVRVRLRTGLDGSAADRHDGAAGGSSENMTVVRRQTVSSSTVVVQSDKDRSPLDSFFAKRSFCQNDLPE